MVWKRRKLAALMVCDVCAPWALNVRVCLRPEEASMACIWATGFRVSLRRGDFGGDVACGCCFLRTHYRWPQSWTLPVGTSEPFKHYFLPFKPHPHSPWASFPYFSYCMSSWMRLQTSALTGSDCQFKWLYRWSSCWRRGMPAHMSLGFGNQDV